MRIVLFAVFSNSENAHATVDALASDIGDAVVHEESLDVSSLLQAQSLELRETDAARSGARGIWLGGAVGIAFGAGAYFTGLLVPWPVAVGIGALAGTGLGGLAAVLVGSGLPDTSLRELEDDVRRGGVLVTFAVPNEDALSRVSPILRRRAVRAVTKRVV